MFVPIPMFVPIVWYPAFIKPTEKVKNLVSIIRPRLSREALDV